MDKFCEDCIHNEVCQYGAIPPHKDRCNDKDTLDDLKSQDIWEDSSHDAISRQAAQAKIKAICEQYHLSYEEGERKVSTGGSAYALGHAFDDLPSVKENKWIPISERLPIRNGVYIVTRIIEGTAISDACYFDGQNTWHRDVCVNHGRPYLTDIMAWQELPEPYEEVVQNDCGD